MEGKERAIYAEIRCMVDAIGGQRECVGDDSENWTVEKNFAKRGNDDMHLRGDSGI